MNIINIDKSISLLQRRTKLLQMQLAASDPLEEGQRVEVKLDGISIEFPREVLIDYIHGAVTHELKSNNDALKTLGCVIDKG